MVKIYVWMSCPFCVRAINLLKKYGVEPEVTDITFDQETFDRLKAEYNHDTVPKVFINETFIGGFTELKALESSGKLEKMISQ